MPKLYISDEIIRLYELCTKGTKRTGYEPISLQELFVWGIASYNHFDVDIYDCVYLIAHFDEIDAYMKSHKGYR